MEERKRRRRDIFEQQDRRRPSNQNPQYVILDWAQATQKPSSGNLAYSQWVNTLPSSISGYNRCAIVHAYMNNYSSFSPNTPMGYIAFNIAEFTSGSNVMLATNQPIVSAVSGVPTVYPTFCVPRQFPYFGIGTTGGTGATPGPDTDSIYYEEEYKNQFNVVTEGLTFTQFTITTCSERFVQLADTGGTPTGFEWRVQLRFYNENERDEDY
jgi:hypothetical protein